MQGPAYRSLFPDLPNFEPEDKYLDMLAQLMSGRKDFFKPIVKPSADAYAPMFERKVKEDDAECKKDAYQIPAGYTYLGQFIVHDLSDDGKNDRHVRAHLPWGAPLPQADIDNLPNNRTPAFDLETIYGPIDEDTNCPQFKYLDPERKDLPLLRLGWTYKTPEYRVVFPCDLPREEGTSKPEIVDARNDENLFVAQLQVAFIKFHNALVVQLAARSPAITYERMRDEARRLAIRCYQKIILEDFLPRIVDDKVYAEVLGLVADGRQEDLFFKAEKGNIFIPLEFAHAAFRFGHSQVRQTYRTNQVRKSKTDVFTFWLLTAAGEMDGNPGESLPSFWILDWNLFFPMHGEDPRAAPALFNCAEPIDTNLAVSLLRLQPNKEQDTPRSVSLAALDLYRSRFMRLADGQTIAKEILGEGNGLSETEIAKAIDAKKLHNTDIQTASTMKETLKEKFGTQTPLWFYILAEAERAKTGKLGAVGSRIVAETIIQLIHLSDYSILQDKNWPDEDKFMFRDPGGEFKMSDLLNFVAATSKQYQGVLYPEFETKNRFTRERIFDEINPLENGWVMEDWPF